MRTLLVLLACLLAAAPAAAERPRTGWNGAAGFSHYFPLTPDERARLMALQQTQRAGDASAARGSVGTSGAFVPQPGMVGGGSPPVCGWAGCRGGAYAAPPFAGDTEGGFRDRCGWAGCR